MNIVKNPDLLTSQTIIKKSKFICLLKTVDTEAAAQAFLATHQDLSATHNCYVYIIGKNKDIIRKNDDGEPTNTASKPMLEVLNHHNLTNIVCLTIRYFGGIKLGAGGLIRAYAHSVSETLKQVTIAEYLHQTSLTINFHLAKSKLVDEICRNYLITNIKKSYHADNVKLTGIVDEKNKDELTRTLNLNQLSYHFS
ncbi:YigZ family protein [Spiroplasma sp. DGKH1]|uniref:YigZ family protein n=1 Tax=Spiroplasma sp. DGKH1 TaxID=3050074 RepID=UPI0034C61A01